jgi:predicted DNA-binding protein (MmcQ/YjbR family)
MKTKLPKLPAISDEMKAWSAALKAETSDWLGVKGRSFFGFTALYRRDRIFALLPRTRAMSTPNSLAFKLQSPKPRLLEKLRQDPRIGSTQMQKARWFTFELAEDGDLHQALDWLVRAYDAADSKS